MSHVATREELAAMVEAWTGINPITAPWPDAKLLEEAMKQFEGFVPMNHPVKALADGFGLKPDDNPEHWRDTIGGRMYVGPDRSGFKDPIGEFLAEDESR